MNLKELDSFKISDAVTFHDKLNPALWAGTKLRPEVKTQLEEIAKDFLEELGIHDLDVRDITISGSNAAYSYTKHSDLDLHILVNIDDLPNNEIYRELFDAKKSLYNDSHDITIHGVPVELYVQDAAKPSASLGEYSLQDDKWLRIPTKRRANFDQTTTKLKFEKLLDIVERALDSKNLTKIQKVLKKIKQYRQAGLDKGGEFGPENLAFKALRSQGWITKLYALRDKLHGEALTIETMYQDPAKIIEDNLADDFASQFEEYKNTDEDYDPNGPPPGPEFKPTMPSGTVKVDVSDVYDWYKLGQHISNLKGLGQHDFGQGPPSTILSFGDEDTEHEYIQDLEKTGLTTTDIDPVDPNQPKGIKRQKTDPTYNVNEGSEDNLDTDYYMKEGCGIFAVALSLSEPGSQIYIISNKNGESWSDAFPYEVTHVFVNIPNKGQYDVLGKRPPEYMANDFKLSKSDYTIKGPFHPNEFFKKFMGNSDIKPLYGTASDIKQLQKQIKNNQSLTEASGYIPSEKEKNDPRFKTALTVDVKPDSIKKNAKAFSWLTNRAGIPPTAKPSGKI